MVLILGKTAIAPAAPEPVALGKLLTSLLLPTTPHNVFPEVKLFAPAVVSDILLLEPDITNEAVADITVLP